MPSRRAKSQMIFESGRAFARRVNGLLNMDDAAFHVARDAFFFLLQASGENDVGVVRRLGHEEIDDAEELQLARALRA